MQPCFTGPCQIHYMWKVMLWTSLLKAHGHLSQFIKIGCAFNSYFHLCFPSTDITKVYAKWQRHGCCSHCIYGFYRSMKFTLIFACKQVGLVLDAAIEMELRMRHLQVADAARASLGLPVLEYTVTDQPLEVKYS